VTSEVAAPGWTRIPAPAQEPLYPEPDGQAVGAAAPGQAAEEREQAAEAQGPGGAPDTVGGSADCGMRSWARWVSRSAWRAATASVGSSPVCAAKASRNPVVRER
jgi:hypothetical protein